MKLKITQTDGKISKVEGTRFSVLIADTKHWFFVHAATGCGGADAVRAVTDYESGRRIAVVTSSQFCAALRDEVGAAKMAIAALIAKVGEQRIRSVLAGAPSIHAKRDAAKQGA